MPLPESAIGGREARAAGKGVAIFGHNKLLLIDVTGMISMPAAIALRRYHHQYCHFTSIIYEQEYFRRKLAAISGS